ncbi:MAG: serine/threonine-protein kinase PknK [Planctomycetota bacterium]|jgi:serine/threonine-protein kinase PknK
MSVRFSVEHDGVTRTFELKKSVVTFGRSHTCTVPVDDPALSRTHCQFEVEGDGCFVRDLNSRNGTTVHGERVDRSELRNGTEIVIGNTQITFLGQGEGTVSPNAASETRSWTERLFVRSKPKKLVRSDANQGQEVKRLRRLIQINRQIAMEIEPERVLSAILDAAVEFVEAERGFLMTVEDEQLFIPVARDFWRKDIPAPAFEVSRSIALEVVKRGKSVITEDASEDGRFEEMVSVYNLKIRSVLCVPLINQSVVVGAIYLDNRFTRGSFSADDINAIEAFADQAAISLVNSGLIAKEREASASWRDEARRRLVELESARNQLSQFESASGLGGQYENIVGRSQVMRDCLGVVDRVAQSDLPVLVRGESGTGKELIAQALHENGPRKKGPFVVLNCGAFPEGMIEKELFGHGRGAFTGSQGSKAGLFELADGGTLFLDEIGDMPESQQRSLLRVLESGEFRRIGEQKLRVVDVRLVSATHQDLEALIKSGNFREDLFYRLKGVEVVVPTLRQRREDIPALIQHFISKLPGPMELAAEVVEALCACDWPGNVRQLRSEIIRLSVITLDDVTVKDISEDLKGARLDDLPGGLKGCVEALERQLLAAAMKQFDGNKTKVAAVLGLSRLGLRKKLARYEMNPEIQDQVSPPKPSGN